MGAGAYSLFLPWIVFAMVDRSDGPGVVWAASVAIVCSVVALALAVRRRGRLLCPSSMVLVFGSLLVIQAAIPDSTAHALDPFARSIVSAEVAVVLMLSLFTGSAIEDHLRSVTPPREWGTEHLRALGLRITARWALIMIALSVAFATAALFHGALLRTACDWLVPLVACIGAVHRDALDWQRRTDWASREIENDQLIVVGPPGRARLRPSTPDPQLGAIHRLRPTRGDDEGPVRV